MNVYTVKKQNKKQNKKKTKKKKQQQQQTARCLELNGLKYLFLNYFF